MSRKIVTVVIPVATMCVGFLAAQAPVTPPGDMRFETITIKRSSGSQSGSAPAGVVIYDQSPTTVTISKAPAAMFVQMAFNLPDYRIVGGPGWMRSDPYDLVAKAANPFSPAERTVMLRNLLGDRFGLRTHMEVRELPLFRLEVSRSDGSLGKELRQSTLDCATAKNGMGFSACGVTFRNFTDGRRTLVVGGMPMSFVAGRLAAEVNRPVIDHTNLPGLFDFSVTFTPERGVPALGNPDDVSLATALHEQLGLRLVPARGPVDVLVVDALDRPAPD